jgi:hypothetical protein
MTTIIAAAVGGLLSVVTLVAGVNAVGTGADDPAKASELYTYADN